MVIQSVLEFGANCFAGSTNVLRFLRNGVDGRSIRTRTVLQRKDIAAGGSRDSDRGIEKRNKCGGRWEDDGEGGGGAPGHTTGGLEYVETSAELI